MRPSTLVLIATLGLAACAEAPKPIAAQPPPPPLPPPPGIERILGKPAEMVTALLGLASMDRQEGPARELQFVRAVCVLDVFLYPVNGHSVVRTAIARRPDGSRIDAGECLAKIALR